MAKKWYVIHTYSGYEAKVRDALQQRAKQYSLEDKFGEILIPSETVTEQRPGGKDLKLREFDVASVKEASGSCAPMK